MQQHYGRGTDYGECSSIRASLAAASLAGATWNQYASAASGFLLFIAAMGLTLAAVTSVHIEMWVCSLLDSHRVAGRPLNPNTVRSKVPAVKAILREVGNPQPASAGLTSVLAGHQRIVNLTTPPQPQKAPWPSHNTMAALRHGRVLLPSTRSGGGIVSGDTWNALTSIAAVVFATITFCRSDTSSAVQRGELHFGTEGLTVKLTKQKRPRKYVPIQTQPWRPGVDCPARFLKEFVSLQPSHGYQPKSLAFGVGPQATKPIALDHAVRTVAQLLGIDQPTTNPFTGHCLRVGSISDAARLGAPLHVISAMPAHKRSDTTRGCLRPGVPVTAAARLFYGWLLPAALQPQSDRAGR